MDRATGRERQSERKNTRLFNRNKISKRGEKKPSKKATAEAAASVSRTQPTSIAYLAFEICNGNTKPFFDLSEMISPWSRARVRLCAYAPLFWRRIFCVKYSSTKYEVMPVMKKHTYIMERIAQQTPNITVVRTIARLASAANSQPIHIALSLCVCVPMSLLSMCRKIHFNFLIPFRWHVNMPAAVDSPKTTRNKMIYRSDCLFVCFIIIFCFLCLFNSFVGASNVQQVEFITLRPIPKTNMKKRQLSCVCTWCVPVCRYFQMRVPFSSHHAHYTSPRKAKNELRIKYTYT